MPYIAGAVQLELETERALYNLLQFTTSRTDTAYCMTSQQQCHYRHCLTYVMCSVRNGYRAALHPATFIIKSRPINSFLWFQKCFSILEISWLNFQPTFLKNKKRWQNKKR